MHHEQPSRRQPVENKNDATLHNTKATATCLTYMTSLYCTHTSECKPLWEESRALARCSVACRQSVDCHANMAALLALGPPLVRVSYRGGGGETWEIPPQRQVSPPPPPKHDLHTVSFAYICLLSQKSAPLKRKIRYETLLV